MKVLIINTVRFKLNGISAVIKNYYQVIKKKNIQMDFLTIDTPSKEYVDFFKENCLECYILSKRNVIKYIFCIIKLCRENKYDIVHIHGNSASMAIELIAVALAGIKVRITHSHNTATMHPWMHKILFPIFSNLCTVRLACGKDAGKWLYRNEKFIVLNNAIETNKYSFIESARNKVRKELGIKNNEILLGHVGNFVEQKNHEFLINIFYEVHRTNEEFKLILVSDGVLMPTIKKKVHLLGLDQSVIFLGKTINVQNYLNAMDLFLLPSLYEGMPLVLIEAQASGLPSLVSNTITKEADLTNTSIYLSIKKIELWVDIIKKKKYIGKARSECSKQNIVKIKQKSYDIQQNADKLYQIYMNGCKK